MRMENLMSQQIADESQIADEGEAPETYGVPTQFQIDSDDAANWMIRKILGARSYSRRCDEWCEREKARAQREEQFFMWRYGEHLVNWVTNKIREQGGRRKSACYPAGMAGFRHQAV